MLALALVSALVQDPPLPPVPPARQMYLGGGVQIQYSFAWGRPGRAVAGHESCINECQGQKHFLHETCDLSCDVRCRAGSHKVDYAAYFHVFNIPLSSVVKDYVQGLKGKAPLQHHIENLANGMRAATDVMKNRTVTRRIGCWNETPCAVSSKGLFCNTYELVMTYQFSQEARNAQGELTGTQPLGPAKTCSIGDLIVPTEEIDTSSYVQCACHIVRYDDEEGTLLDPGPGGETPPTPPPPPAEENRKTGCTGVRLNGPEGALCGSGMLEKFQCSFQFEDMNQGMCTARNPMSMPVTLHLPAGTWFDTDADGVQDVLLIVDASLKLPAAGTARVRVDRRTAWPSGTLLDLVAWQGGQGSATLRVMCMEMSKREPNLDAKYVPRMAKTPEFARIGQEISKAFGRGPWDQAKVWIYSDAATYADIEKKLIPSPSEGQYVRAMHDLLRLGVDMRDERFAGCYEARLLAGASNEAAGKWFAGEMLSRDPAAVRQWVRGEGREALLKLLGGRPDQVKQFAIVANALCGHASAEAQRAGLALLEAVPEAARPKLAKENLLAAWSLGWSEDAALKAQALGLMEAFGSEAGEFVRVNGGGAARP